MTAGTHDGWSLLRAESSIWAMAPDHLGLLAERIANRSARGASIADLKSNRRYAAPAAGTAIVPIVGPLVRRGGFLSEMFGLSSYSQIRAQINAAVADSSISRILLWTDSPGGDAIGCEEVNSDVVHAARKKTVIAYVDGYCASAALWAVCGANEIVSTSSGQIGSIGVYAFHLNIGGAMAKASIVPTFVVSKVSPYKVEGNEFEALEGDALAAAQRDVDAIATKFVSAAARGRGVTNADVAAKFGGGRVLFASDAKRVGLIDAVGSVGDALSMKPSGVNRVSAHYRATLAELKRNALPPDAAQRRERLERLKKFRAEAAAR